MGRAERAVMAEPSDLGPSDRWYVRTARRVCPLDRAEEQALTAALERQRDVVASDVLGSSAGRAYLRGLRTHLEGGTLDVRDVVEVDADERVEAMRAQCLARLVRIEQLAASRGVSRTDARLVRERRALRLRSRHIRTILARMEAARPAPAAALAAYRDASAAATRARARLVESHLRLVIAIARRHAGRGLDLPDLVQEGTIGLMRAVDRFETSRGVTFATYATWWVRQTIGRALANQARPIRLPIGVEESLQRVRKERRRLVLRHGRTPTSRELASVTRLPVERVDDLVRVEREVTRPHLSFDEPSPDDPDGRTPAETLADEERPGPEDAAVARCLIRQTRLAMRSLAPRERQVLRLRYGFGRANEHTLEEIGRKFGLTRQRILQIAAKALAKLRASCHAERLRGFYEP